ncbi:hypothetical protein MMC26_002234 [Xylographa opegraphella]|nr:hypothetical protein [Xylographa opegraphella]
MTSPPPPFPLVPLCNQTLTAPSSLTPTERALLKGRPSPADEDILYRNATTLPLSALVAKALATPPTLTPHEAHILVHGPAPRTPAEKASRLQRYLALTPTQRQLLDRASDAVADKEEKRARNVAYRVLQALQAEASTSPAPARAPLVFPWERTDWVSLVREQDYAAWGFPVLRTAYCDPAAWLAFRARFSALAAREMQRLAPAVADRFRVPYVEDEEALAGAEREGLLAYYTRLRAEGKLAGGFDWGVFGSVDEKVLEECGAEEGEWVVPVWDAEWKEGGGWVRGVGVQAGLVFAVLLPKVVRGEKGALESLAMLGVDR